MAYRMNKQREGQYVYMVAAFEPKYNVELERNLRFTEPVMRFLVTARLKPLADGE
jgi:small subunit ribosomal protein S6